MTDTSIASVELCPVLSSVDKGTAELRDGMASRVLLSRRFGRLEVFPDQILHFSPGLLGFEELQAYCLVAPEALRPLMFLVACDDPEVAFPVLPARMCLAEYTPILPPEALEAVGAVTDEGLDILAICAMAPDTMTLHANLRGPVLINMQKRLGYQAVLPDSPYSLRHLLGAG
jgi:flagellar assembly factor FliW